MPEPRPPEPKPRPELDPGDEAAPGAPGTGEDLCRVCHGTGKVGAKPCDACGGTGIIVEGIGGA
ncbi:MAG: hypothetical protein ACM31L_13295 [Actinomycetota bacterium]